MSGALKRTGEENRLSLRATAPQAILHEENFHCPREPGAEIRRLRNMSGFLGIVVRWAILALGVALAARIVPGISYTDGLSLLLVVVLLALFNAFLRPVLVLFALPFVVLTLGLGLWLINALVLYVIGKIMAPGFVVAGFGSALLGSAIISLTNMFLTRLVGAKPQGVEKKNRGAPPKRGRDDDIIDV